MSHVDRHILMMTQRLVCIREAPESSQQDFRKGKETHTALKKSTTMKKMIKSSNHRIHSTWQLTKKNDHPDYSKKGERTSLNQINQKKFSEDFWKKDSLLKIQI